VPRRWEHDDRDDREHGPPAPVLSLRRGDAGARRLRRLRESARDAQLVDFSPANWAALDSGGRFRRTNGNLAAVAAAGNGYFEMDIDGLVSIVVAASGAVNNASVTPRWSLNERDAHASNAARCNPRARRLGGRRADRQPASGRGRDLEPGHVAAGDLRGRHVYFKSNSTAGQNLHLCTAANTWTQMTGGNLANPVTPSQGGSGVANSKNLTWSASLTLAGTDATTMTFPHDERDDRAHGRSEHLYRQSSSPTAQGRSRSRCQRRLPIRAAPSLCARFKRRPW
jgi:hypothetical protein